METKKTSTVRIVLLIIGIMFTICLYPVFLFLPLGGGALSGVINFFQDKNVENIITTSKISATILDESWKEAEQKYAKDSGIKMDALSEIYRRVILPGEIDDLLFETWKSMYAGKKVNYDFSVFEDRLNDEVDTLFQDVPEDLFRAWKGNSSSKYFTDSYLEKMVSKINDAFDGLTYEEVKARYEMTGATEPFDSYIEKEWKTRKNELDIQSYTETSEVLTEVKQTLENSVNEAIGKTEVRDFFESLKKAQSYSKMLYIVVYGVILLVALFLLVFYLFAPGGFYVTGAGMVLGGLICGIAKSFHGAIMKIITGAINEGTNTAGSIGDSVEPIVINIIDAAMKTLEEEIWKFGRISCILGIILIGIGIFLHVMAKNKKVIEE